MNTHYLCQNYRPNTRGESIDGSSRSPGCVIADLYDDETGEFHRAAVVADCRDAPSAKRYADEMNTAK